MVQRYVGKVRKAVWFGAIRSAGAVRPRSGTALALRFYGSTGMNIVGKPTFIAPSAWFDGTQNYALITLHEGCNISSDVRVLTHDWAPYCTFKALGRIDTAPVGRVLPVEIGPHAFIGMGALLLPGSRIGRGAIVGAGAVVRGEVPDYGIVVGNPGAVVGDARDYLRRKFPDEWRRLQLPSTPREE